MQPCNHHCCFPPIDSQPVFVFLFPFPFLLVLSVLEAPFAYNTWGLQVLEWDRLGVTRSPNQHRNHRISGSVSPEAAIPELGLCIQLRTPFGKWCDRVYADRCQSLWKRDSIAARVSGPRLYLILTQPLKQAIKLIIISQNWVKIWASCHFISHRSFELCCLFAIEIVTCPCENFYHIIL